MHIAYYCQHVLGVGHFFRSLEICRGLHRHRLTLVTGGPPVDVGLPSHVTELRLPALKMDANFKILMTGDAEVDIEMVKARRADLFYSKMTSDPPDALLIELYPFGRNAFRFEIEPVLTGIRTGQLPEMGVFCSLRDVLVEKQEQEFYERRVVERLNRDFDALLVHADPAVVRLEETFTRLEAIDMPVVYTGYVTPVPPADSRERVRRQLGIDDRTALIVASAGSGSVGAALLEAALSAVARLAADGPLRMQVFTGPHCPEAAHARLLARAPENVSVMRFTDDFPGWLAAADLSLSMAGYNTTMNLLAARTPALVLPFDQNREQRMRAERLAALGALGVLEAADLDPRRLAKRMAAALKAPHRQRPLVDLNGAASTADWIERWAAQR